jgi:hypothetical protein
MERGSFEGVNDFTVPGTNTPAHSSYWHEMLALASQAEENRPRVATHSHQALERR